MLSLVIQPDQRAAFLDGAQLDLGSRAFDVLQYLSEHADRVVSKAELLDHVWSDRMVEESNLTVQIASLRKALGRRAISTVPGVGYKFTLSSAPASAPSQNSAAPTPPGTDKPSLAVLPFANLTGDTSKDYLVDGIVNELSSSLSLVSSFFVISTTSTFTYKGRAVDLAEVGRELGVHYVVEGSIQQAGDQIRISTQLVECDTGHTIWRDKLDGSSLDIFDLQDRVAENVTAAIEPKLIWAESARVRSKPTDSMAAYDLCLKAAPMVYLQNSRERLETALALLRHALELDPDYIQAKALICYAYTGAFASRWCSFEDARAALPLARAVMDSTTDDPLALTYAGHYTAYIGHDPEQGLVALKRASRLNPNSATVAMLLGWVHNYLGQSALAVEQLHRARRISPLHPQIGMVTCGLGLAALLDQNPEKAVEHFEQARGEYPEFATNQLWLMACYWTLGQPEKAQEMADWLRAKVPDMSVSSYLESRPHPAGFAKELMIRTLKNMGFPP